MVRFSLLNFDVDLLNPSRVFWECFSQDDVGKWNNGFKIIAAIVISATIQFGRFGVSTLGCS